MTKVKNEETMTIAYFLQVDGPAGQHDVLQSWAGDHFGPALINSGNTKQVEVYAPRSVNDPYLGSESGKLLMVQADFQTRDELESTLKSALVSAALAKILPNENFKVTCEAFSVRHFALPDGTAPVRRAPISFVVRYYPPIKDQQAFNDHYVKHHPPIMRHFPRVRNVLCYFPINWQNPTSVAPSQSFLGNELVFDSIEDLNAALASDVRHELRADYRLFPPHEGTATHYAMCRRVIF